MSIVIQEEELEAIKFQQEEFEAIRNVELAEVQRLENEARRKAEEKERRIKQVVCYLTQEASRSRLCTDRQTYTDRQTDRQKFSSPQ